ncbi:hypothetical protein C0V75_19535 [Tabrizicola sp. TH137]|uniref:hypothetical protein n=1 Tax=Tabrizicola sp. TH137 TaxID=2067452 RepID=UPI000C7AE733|nr:hypothetical protein [Tabrizicola sp. TH137]PLL10870.1 hypothetical protein C0V75_19535 [Tabrizicola sp. TH137]
MTDPILLPALLGAVATEAQDLAEEVRRLEAALVPALAARCDLGASLQGLDPLLQRLTALSRLAAKAAAEAPAQPMPAATSCLQTLRLARFMRALRCETSPACAADPTVFDPLP